MNQGLEISSTSLFLCEMSSKCFEIIILFLLHIIRVILSKPCHMFDKRGLGNSGQTYHIIGSVLVVAAFQISPGTHSSFHQTNPSFMHFQVSNRLNLFPFFFFVYFFSKRLRNNRHQLNFLVVFAKDFPYHQQS